MMNCCNCYRTDGKRNDCYYHIPAMAAYSNERVAAIVVSVLYRMLTLYKDGTIVINPQIASRANIDSLKLALAYNVTDGLGQPAKSDKTTVAGKQGTIVVSTDDGNTMYAVEFCGYFPTGNPKYSIIVSINKTGLPASGGLMAGDVFKQIVELLFP